ncbi:MAG: Succinyl-diaminopimelate desuccinylase [Gemmatimonadaceae bacterium]|nr:Succinyl-diaminopimelate desuccinylase [Gemmatimonadaceae bacterium]
MKRILLLLAFVGVGLVAIMTFRATRLRPHRTQAGSLDPQIESAPVSVDRFAAALRFPTVSTQDSVAFDQRPFLELHDYLRTAYPKVDSGLVREVVSRYSLLYTWRGSDTTLAPMLLMGHLDVVPVEAGTESMWKHPPFAGDTAGGFLWGRGSLDDKASVLGILEAADLLLSIGFRPERTILFAFGHDEELGGYAGAAELASVIQQRYGRVSFLVDEGGTMSQGMMPGVKPMVGLVAVAEKSSASIELTVEGAGGHSSMPPDHSALGVLARALTRIEDNQMKPALTPVMEQMLLRLAPEMPFGTRMAIANLWLLRPAVVAGLLGDEKTATMLRTSTAVTMASGSPKENVLPIRARAVVNFRIRPGETPNDVLRHVSAVVGDTAVHARMLGTPREPSPVADYDAPEFAILERTIAQTFPGSVTVPFLLAGATDTRHYEGLTRNVYRFLPTVATPDILSGAHGTNERTRTADFIRGVRFFAQLMKNAQ